MPSDGRSGKSASHCDLLNYPIRRAGAIGEERRQPEIVELTGRPGSLELNISNMFGGY
jgi:hypothetical protein